MHNAQNVDCGVVTDRAKLHVRCMSVSIRTTMLTVDWRWERT